MASVQLLMDALNTEQDATVVRKLRDRSVRREEKVSSERRKELERKENTLLTRKAMDEWLPVVKRNREKEQLDFTQDLGLNGFRMNAKANDAKKSALSAFERRLNQKL